MWAGSETDAQQRDEMTEGSKDKFFLQYYFPPSSVGETGRVGAPGRREVGHGQLAQRALTPIIPNEVRPRPTLSRPLPPKNRCHAAPPLYQVASRAVPSFQRAPPFCNMFRHRAPLMLRHVHGAAMMHLGHVPPCGSFSLQTLC